MSYSPKNKTALITGSTDGLGKKIAFELASHGSNVIIHGKSSEKVAETLAAIKEAHPTGNHQAVVSDFSNLAAIEEQFAEIKALDILVNNAGIWLEGATEQATSDKISELVQVNLGALLVLTKVMLPKLSASAFGQVLNVSSIAGVEIPSGYFHTIYSATKFGVQAFSEALAKEYVNSNVRVMGFYPGGMDTDLFKKAGNAYEKQETWMFDPQESVEAIVFMLTRNPKVNVKRMDLINHLLE